MYKYAIGEEFLNRNTKKRIIITGHNRSYYLRGKYVNEYIITRIYSKRKTYFNYITEPTLDRAYISKTKLCLFCAEEVPEGFLLCGPCLTDFYG